MTAAPARAPRQVTAELPDDPLDLLPPGAVVAVAMSGGVDSSVAAARLVERGVAVVGITLAMWEGTREQVRDRGCCSVDAVDDARRVCARLGVAHFVWNLEEAFRREVVHDFEEEYSAGRTPNPCVRCNERIKFGLLLERALAVGAGHLATGHYARIGRRGARWTLHRGADGAKDQAYTLHRLGQDRLARAVFPVGALPSKAAVRSEARRLGLPTAAKADSQELCFVDGPVRDDLARRLRGRYAPGPVVDLRGRRIGGHRGLPFYTVGQRSGFDVAPDRPDRAPLHVVALDPAANALVAGPREALLRTRVAAADCRWVGGDAPPAGARCTAQLRAHGSAHAAVVESAGGTSLQLLFDPPVAQVSPGQAVVLYDGDEVLGGGVIAEAA